MSTNKITNKQNSNVLIGALIILIVGGLLFWSWPTLSGQKTLEEVNIVVETFGRRMQNVNLSETDQDTLSLNIEKEYGDLVISPVILVEWLREPYNAPGKQIANGPWPDNVEILSTEKLNKSSYEVKGEVMILDSNSLGEGCIVEKEVNTEAEGCKIKGYVVKQDITFLVERSTDKGNYWLISKVTLGDIHFPNDEEVNNVTSTDQEVE